MTMIKGGDGDGAIACRAMRTNGVMMQSKSLESDAGSKSCGWK